MRSSALLQLFHGFGDRERADRAVLLKSPLPGPLSADGTFWLLAGFLLMNLLVLLEVADRLTLKRDLEIAREIQRAMLPQEMVTGGRLEAYGFTRPANTVGGDFYDVLPDARRPARRSHSATSPGKGSPAALLMALHARHPAHARRRGPRLPRSRRG